MEQDTNFNKCPDIRCKHSKKAHTSMVHGRPVNTACNYAGCPCKDFERFATGA